MPNPNVLRTPDSRFENLPDYDFTPNYLEIGNLRIHYVDEGPEDALPILLLHGEPSWSYLYRKMIPLLVSAGYRVVAPDLLGFGKSDKPTRTKDYTYQKHVDIMHEFVKRLNLNDVTLFCQDWGELIGLRVVGIEPERFARIVASNTALPSAKGIFAKIGYPLFKLRVRLEGKVTPDELQANPNFIKWVAFSRTVPELDIGGLIQGSTLTRLSPEEKNAYDAPFPDSRYKAGAKTFPWLAPSQLAENKRVWDNVLSKWEKPFLTAFSDSDPITAGGHKYFQKMIPGAQRQKHVTIEGAGHFLQEDKSEEIAQIIVKFIEQTQ
ncbi:MAG: haloalkane dehalogenase [Candidatus Thorarchaeota archaeon]